MSIGVVEITETATCHRHSKINITTMEVTRGRNNYQNKNNNQYYSHKGSNNYSSPGYSNEPHTYGKAAQQNVQMNQFKLCGRVS